MIEIYERSGRKAKLEECYYRMLDVDPGKATNRTVVTFVGQPEVVVEAAFAAMLETIKRKEEEAQSAPVE